MKKLKGLTLLLALVGLLVINGTLAWLVQEASLKNTFEVAEVSGEIVEDFNKEIKKDVYVTNTGNFEAYVRVALVPSWVDDKGNATMLNPEGTYEIDLNLRQDATEEGWIKGSDGFYYYTKPLLPGEKTAILINTCKPTVTAEQTEYQGKAFKMDVMAQWIQAKPKEAVEKAWGVAVDKDNGMIIKK